MSTHSAQYKGRFAPTPSGPLHFGSLVAAVGSYLQAKTHKGQWLVRMEDTDLQRNKKDADSLILRTLEQFGFEWDGEISYQSQRSEFYEQALQQLEKNKHIYSCSCSRQTILDNGSQGDYGIIYAGTCSNKSIIRNNDRAIRLAVSNENIKFTDQVFGHYQQNLAKEVGDFHLLRRDQCYAYHLAVVVDDFEQGISEVVRGYDIIDSTPRHIFLQECLKYHKPAYLHLPLAVDDEGQKLSKHTFADAIDASQSVYFIYKALSFLGQQPEKAILDASLDEIWHWAINNWNLISIPRSKNLCIDV